MNTILSRIQEIIINEGVSIGAMERTLGASKGVLSHAISNGTDIQSKWIEKLVEKYPIYNTEWLLTGKGPMLKGAAPIHAQGKGIPEDAMFRMTPEELRKYDNKKQAEKKESDKTYMPLTNSKTKFVLQDISSFPLYNIDAAAGLDKLFVGDSDLIGRISIPNAPRCDGAVHVIGDSMYPLLKSGDIIAYRQIHNLQSIIYGEIYLLQLENEGDLSIVVKYVKKSELGDDYIKLVSYNKEHDPKDIPLSWVKAIARVTLTIRKFSIT